MIVAWLVGSLAMVAVYLVGEGLFYTGWPLGAGRGALNAGPGVGGRRHRHPAGAGSAQSLPARGPHRPPEHLDRRVSQLVGPDPAPVPLPGR